MSTSHSVNARLQAGIKFAALVLLLASSAAGLGVLKASALTMDELYWSQPSWSQGQVLGESTALTETSKTLYLTSPGNKSLKLSVTPVKFVDGKWQYVVQWNRTLNRAGSVYVSLKTDQGVRELKLDPAPKAGSETVYLKPDTRYRAEFFASANRRGTVLLRKYFTTPKSPEPIAVCDYPAPPANCSYIKGPNYNQTTNCGMTLKCEPVACTQEAKLCPDGKTSVGRTGPNCEFAACPATPITDCKQLWYTDSSTATCTQKQFCGAYMYQGLRTFETEAACKLVQTPATPSTAFRYLKVDTTNSKSWVAWLEIEVYGKDGNKISIPATAATASHAWANYPYKVDGYVTGPQGLVDGDVNTGWNAGETAVGCNWAGITAADRNPCITAVTVGTRAAWVQLDLGAVKDVSKIRFMAINTPDPSGATHRLLVRNTDSEEWREIKQLKGDVKTDHKWIEYVVGQ